MITDEKIESLCKMGFNRWQKNGMDRLYINAGKLGLSCTYYNTGNISNAKFQGKSISNSEARRMKAAKTYIDLKQNQIISDNAALSWAAAEMAELPIEDDARSWDNILSIKEDIN